MNKECIRYREELIDALYGEISLDTYLKNHLDTCEECRVYFKELQQLKEEITEITPEIPIEYGSISMAFERATEIENSRENLKGLLLFIVLGAIILSSVTSLAIAGYLKGIIFFQAVMYTIMPILLPIIIKLRVKREEYEG